MKTVFLFICVLVLSSMTDSLFGAVKLARIFSDNMVLQQEVAVPIWGWAEKGEKVSVTFGGQEKSTITDDDGRWRVTLDSLKASAVPAEMSVVGSTSITVKNILVGEVWICSGQSNMEFPLEACKVPEEVRKAVFPEIRHFKVARKVAEEPETDCMGDWAVCTPQTVGKFSAAGYFFARELHQKLGVPIGLVNSTWGGTGAEVWITREGLQSEPEFKIYDDEFAKKLAAFPNEQKAYEVKLSEWNAGGKVGKAPVAPLGKGSPRTPTGLFNGMIAPLIPMAMRGTIWYQGEANRGNPLPYRKLFPALIQDWRRVWGQGDFPFLFVQLANNTPMMDQPVESNWALIREAQLMSLSVPNTGMAVTIDIGDAGDLHPKNKLDVGKRLALNAFAKVYGQKVLFSGPIYKSMSVESGKVRLNFDHVGSGLEAKGEKLHGFALSGSDKKFVWADAVIVGETVELSTPLVPDPVAVRYAWADNPLCNLYNKEGLPASPFRTDDWMIQSAPRQTLLPP